ncbi:MAG: PDC sensor domain-containing protein [Thiohalophilus sp.]
MTDPKAALKESIVRQRESLTKLLQSPLYEIAEACSRVWGDRRALDTVLQEKLDRVPNCKFMYALDTDAVQISDNVSRDGIIENDYGRDRSTRPYMCEAVPSSGFLLSDAYISLRAMRPSLTAIQLVRNNNGKVLGFVGADFDLRDLPLTRELYEEPRYWQQIKGDPSIRGTVFHQSRVDSEMDKHFDTILSVIEELMTGHGVFHVILHFSSSRAIIWQMEDPYRYRLLDIDSLIDPDICLAYPHQSYSGEAAVPADKISEVLEAFKILRFMDETLYLRSGTLNIFNGLVGLTFSCDGSHYIPYDEFLDKQHAFWDMSVNV